MAVVCDPPRGLPMGALAHRSAFVRGDEAEFVGRDAAVAVRFSRLVGESALGLLALIPVLRVLEPARAALLTRSGSLRPLAFQILDGDPPGVIGLGARAILGGAHLVGIEPAGIVGSERDRKSTRLNSSH